MPRAQRDITFETISTEGFVLPADLLQRVAILDADLKHLTPQSYHLAENEKLNEAINRSWVRLLGIWTAFKTHVEKITETDPAIGLTRDKWIMHIMQELGFGRPPLAKGIEIEGKVYQVSHLWQNVPVHMTGINVDLDRRTPGV